MYKITTNSKFNKDVKLLKKRKYNMQPLSDIIELLEENGQLPEKHKTHKLKGNYKGFWECHIKFDWLLIWLQDDTLKEIELHRTGTHTDLFNK